MDNRSSWSSTTFELEDIEIINHQTENEEKLVKWQCDQCSLYFLEKSKLDEHKKKHPVQEIVKCKYCQKTISSSSGNRECYINRKCETCEYKCSKCPQRFLRHSSLMNHEKKHSSPKRKRSINNNKKINGTNEETIGVSKGLKKKQLEAEDSEKQFTELKIKNGAKMKTASKRKTNLEVKATSDGGESTPINVPRRLSMKARKSAETKNNCEPAKAAKRLSMKTNKLPEDKHSDIKSKQNPIVSSQTISPTTNASSSENVVNYKPFSCHVCGDTFASDGALLDHIRTHGENAAKSFKCKFCGDEFDDIYKMQYHLAICPLAEDELESSLKQVIPANIPLKYSGGTSTPRKRGRPKKIVELPLEPEDLKNESTPSPVKRGKFRKRKSDVVEQSNGTEENSFELPLPKQSKKSLNKEPLTQPDSNRVAKDNELDTVSGDIVEVTKESDLDEERKKIHQCPFPRCDFKFTREKALLCHMRNHSDDFDDSLKCHKCDIPFDDIHTLRLHINTCKGIKEERDEDFNRAGSYDPSPNRTFQRTKRDFVCNQCGKSYQSQEKLNRHLESCGSKFVCRICKDDFLNQPLLDEHFGSKHPPYTAYHCYICEEDFISELFLQIHQSDEHGQKSNTKPAPDIVRETIPAFPEIRNKADSKPASDSVRETIPAFPETRNKADSASAKVPIDSSPVNITPRRTADNICSSPLTNKSVRSTDKTLTNPVTVLTGQSSRYSRCPICLVGFDRRDDMQAHFRERHVVENNSTYSCEICEVKMPFAEMLSYHLELHSRNLLSVNRFSKLIAYVKQNRVSELKSSEVEVKCEKVSEDETSSRVKEATNIAKADIEKSSQTVYSLNKVVTNESRAQQSVRNIPRDNLVGDKKSDVMNLELLEERNSTSDSRRKIKCTFTKDKSNTTENSSINDSWNVKTELIHNNLNDINLEKPTRPLRSRAKINYSLREKGARYFAKQNEKTSDEGTCIETESLKDKSDLREIDDSVATKETGSAQRPGRLNRRAQKKKFFDLRTKKQIKYSPLKTDTKTDAHSKPEDSIGSEDSVNQKFSLVSDKKEISLPVDDKILNTQIDKKNVTLFQVKKRQNINKFKHSSNSLSKRTSENETDFENDSNDVPSVLEETSTNIENNKTAEHFSVDNSESEVIVSDSLGNGENEDINFEFKERTIQPVTQSLEQNSPKKTGGTFSELTEESNETETKRIIQSEESTDSGTTNDRLTEVEYSGAHSPTGRKEPVHEESVASTTSTMEESICCTMCTESFYNQDELLDHLATHI